MRAAVHIVHRLSIGLTLAATLATSAQAQRVPTPEVPAAISAIKEADLKRDVHAMASAAMRGREGGTLDELRASGWVAEQYRALGLEPHGDDGTYFQWFNITRTRVSSTTSAVAIGGRAMVLWGDIIALGTVPAEASGAVVWVANAADTTTDVRGKIVATPMIAPEKARVRITSYPEPVRYTDAAILATTAHFARRGAAALLIVADARSDSVFDAMAVMRNRGAYDVDRGVPRAAGQSDRVAPVPTLGAGATPAFLVRASMATELTWGPPAEISVRLERFEYPSVNVLGVLRGSDARLKNEYVLYSSHQDANGVRFPVDGDSTWYGADDNASVTAAEFAAARALMKQRPRRSVLFVNHGAEERGLLGSRWHAAHPVVPIEQIVAVLNGDMIGRNHPDSAALLGAQPPHRSSSDLAAMALRANALTGKFVLDTIWDRPTHPEGWFFRSDHLPYARRNVPSLMYSSNLHDDYHTPGDSPSRIDYAKLTRMAQWMYLTGWFAANAPARPALDAGFKLER